MHNPSRVFTRDATAAVSYKGVKVAGGGVPVVYAGRSGGEGEVQVAMWAADLDAAVRLVRSPDGELTHGTVVDAAVRVPRAAVARHGFYRDFNLACSGVKVGEGPTPCNEFVDWS